MFSVQLQDFLEISTNVPAESLRSVHLMPTILSPKPIREKALRINALHYDVISGVLFVGTGSYYTSILISKDRVRGNLLAYRSQSISDDPGVFLSGMEEVCCKAFNIGVVALEYDSSCRCVYVGLATGPILFFQLSADATELIYCSELDCHKGVLCNIITDRSSGVLVSASDAGTLTVYDLKECITRTPLVVSKGSAKFVSFAYDRSENMAYCGTDAGTVCVYDLEKNPPILIHTITLSLWKNKEKEGKADVIGLFFIEETRLLYCAHEYKVHVLKMSHKVTIEKSSLRFLLSMSEQIEIADLRVLYNGQYIVVSSGEGPAAMFEISEKLCDVEKSHGFSMSDASVTDELSTSASRLLPWQEVIKRSDATLRDWLRANSVNTSVAYTHSDLIRLVRNTEVLRVAEASCDNHKTDKNPKGDGDIDRFEIERIADNLISSVLIPKIPRTDALFSWIIPDNRPESSLSLKKAPLVNTTCYMENIRAVAYGCEDGNVHFVSVSEFFSPMSDAEKSDIDRLRLNVTKDVIGGSTKSTRGRKSTLS